MRCAEPLSGHFRSLYVQGASRQKNWDLGVSLNPRAVARAGIANQSLTGLLQRIPGSASMLIRHSPDS
jgi:hypothetical protein